MKGLIRNNFYNVKSSLKFMLPIILIAMILMVMVGLYFPNNTSLISAIISGIIGSFGGLSGTAMQKDGASMWNKFELTMPISRNDVIKARYLSALLYILIGTLLAILSVLLFYLASASINLERVFYGFSFGLTFAISIPTFMYPFVLIFGSDKYDLFMMISIFMGVGSSLVYSAIFAPFLSNFSNSNLVFRLGSFIFSMVLFAASYLLSLFLYKRKEL